MRVGIDITDLATGIVGVGSVILNQLCYLNQHDIKNEYFLYQNDEKDYCSGVNFHKRRACLPSYAYLREQVYFSSRAVIDNLDIFHAPIHLPPKILSSRTKVVMTVHDLHVELDKNGMYSDSMRKYFVPRRVKAISDADAVIVHSNKVKNDVLSLCGISKEKIHCFPLGIKQEFLKKFSNEDLINIRHKYNLPEKYILFVGSVEPWKRCSFLIEAFKKFRNKNNINLVIIGRKGGSNKECDFVEAAVNNNADIHWLESVASEDLPLIYKNALLFTSASIFEGVGMIFLEAMAQGIPVIGANAAAIPETIGDAGLIFNPDDVDDLVNKFNLVLENDLMYDDLSDKALRRSTKFSWDDYGKNIFQLYEKMM